MSDLAPAVKRILRENGCEFVRKGNGDHEMWKSPISGKKLPCRFQNLVPPYSQRHHEAGGSSQGFLGLLPKPIPENQACKSSIRPD